MEIEGISSMSSTWATKKTDKERLIEEKNKSASSNVKEQTKDKVAYEIVDSNEPEKNFASAMALLSKCDDAVESMEDYVESFDVSLDGAGAALDGVEGHLKTTVNSADVNFKAGQESLKSEVPPKKNFLFRLIGKKIEQKHQEKMTELLEKMNDKMERIEDNAYDVKMKIKETRREVKVANEEKLKEQKLKEKNTKPTENKGEDGKDGLVGEK